LTLAAACLFNRRDAMDAKPASDKDEGRTLRATLRELATADPRTLGLFRILFGVFLLVDLYRRIPDFVLFYTNEGMLPNHGAIFRPMSGHIFSLYHAFSTRGEVGAAFALTAVVYVLYLVGWKTKVMQVAVLVLVTSLHSRNVMLENGGDVVSNIVALWTCFLPVGRRFSVDAMLASLRERHENGPDDLNDRTSPIADTRPVVALAYAAAFVNLALIYYFNVVHKDGPVWQNATAVHYVFWADRLVQQSGVWLRGLPMPLIRVMTGGTLVMEASIVILLLCPVWIRSCRRVAALLIIALHCGFQSVGHFGLFSFIMMLHAPLLIGPEDWDALARRMKAKLPSRVVYYDASCGLCHQLARIAKRLDHLGKLRFVANDDEAALPAGIGADTTERTLVVSDLSGKRTWTRASAVAECFRALPYGVVIARLMDLPVLSSIANAAYDAVAARRKDMSMAMGYAACGVPQKFGDAVVTEPEWRRPPLFGPWGPRVSFALTLFFVIALGSQVLAENRAVPARACGPKQIGPLMTPSLGALCLPWNLKNQPQWMAAVAQYPRFFQGWSMFAPVPPGDDGILVVDAITVDGRHIDPLTDGKPPTFELPGPREGMLVTQFWYEFHDRIRRDVNTRYRDHFRDYLVGWQAIERRPVNDRIVSFEVWWIWRNTLPPGRYGREEVKRQKIMQWGEAPGSVRTEAPTESGRPNIRVPLPAAPKP
jgi:predicted DCC family thiol-disulfide oxidoreductase YuxK